MRLRHHRLRRVAWTSSDHLRRNHGSQSTPLSMLFDYVRVVMIFPSVLNLARPLQTLGFRGDVVIGFSLADEVLGWPHGAFRLLLHPGVADVTSAPSRFNALVMVMWALPHRALLRPSGDVRSFSPLLCITSLTALISCLFHTSC
jgi:hypothetical protein